METVFIHNGHRIVVINNFTSIECTIDGVMCGQVLGFSAANRDQTFTGIAHNPDGSEDTVRIEYKDAQLKKLFSSISLYYNDILVDEKKTL